ncbi:MULTISPECIES: hydroxypyruvate isomerase family protein [Nocardiopsis]|uniref:TIM barrel protein n=1 Tax=Nocardiopsis lambiniae TaxID=3075539 RepID=A0ABU2M475_9ACTN|nr:MULTISPECIES: TIM barrel protein [unclassified Nocardiopsis]MDE3720091.1 TIM barrel protein [Nocardiopsis sp. N85]MDT0327402.1 TIM barrel protein [Nocardiopsis sp. DSM 44743]
MSHTLGYTVNCSMLFTELPLHERPQAARDAGFDAVEFWWPFESATPPREEIDAFVAALDTAGVRLTGLNLFAGALPGPDRGVLSQPARSAEFLANLDVVVAIAERTGTTAFNALYGLRQDGVDPAEQDRLALENTVAAAEAVARVGGIVLIEPLSGAEGYPLRTARDGLDFVAKVREAGADNVALLADLYHLAVNGDDVAAVVRDHAAEFGHVQIADVPGRGEPGTGALPIDDLLTAAQAGGYQGLVGLEYKPTVPTEQSLGRLR